jgi:hypothetical protein
VNCPAPPENSQETDCITIHQQARIPCLRTLFRFMNVRNHLDVLIRMRAPGCGQPEHECVIKTPEGQK